MPHERFRVLISLTPNYRDEDGGFAAIMEGPYEDSNIARLIRPVFNAGYAFQQTANSYHAVTETRNRDRLTLVCYLYPYLMRERVVSAGGWVRRSSALIAYAIAIVASLAPASALSGEAIPSVTVPVAADTQGDGAVSSTALRLGKDFVYRRPAADVTDVASLRLRPPCSSRSTRRKVNRSRRRRPPTGPAFSTTTTSASTSGPRAGTVSRTPSWPTRAERRTRRRRRTAATRRAGLPSLRAPQADSRVAMTIPLDAIRAGGSTTWRAQFVRAVVATGALDVWAYSAAQSSATDSSFAGELAQIGGRLRRGRPPYASPRAVLRPRQECRGVARRRNVAHGR